MKLKTAILTSLGRDTLKTIVDELEVDGVDRRSVESMRKVLSRLRRLTPETLLEYLYKDELQQVCERS